MSGREQLQAHRLLLRRMAGAVVAGTADPPVTVSRTGPALAVGASVAAAALATAAVLGVLGIGPADWHRNGTIIVERESGTRFMLVDGALRPVRNTASARLIAGAADPSVTVVARHDLASTRRGPAVGIAGAPDALPATLAGGPWTVCSVADDAGTRAVLRASGSPVSGGRDIGAGALYVRSGDDASLLWQGRRIPVDDPGSFFATRGWRDPAAAPVDAALLAAFPVARIDPPASTSLVAGSVTSVCVAITPDGDIDSVVVGGTSIGRGVIVPAGSGGLVRSAAAPTGFASLCLLTDAGKCYPVPDAASLASLGYAAAPVVLLPPSILALLPRGPTLSRTGALST